MKLVQEDEDGVLTEYRPANKNPVGTRKDIQFMQSVLADARIFGTCLKRQYACLLVDERNHIVGHGYNGVPSGMTHCEDGGCPRAQEDSPSGSVYDNCYAIHAEQNALLHSNYDAHPVKLYVNGPPCFTCAKLIANTTIKTVFYIPDDAYADWDKVGDFLNDAGVNTIACQPAQQTI